MANELIMDRVGLSVTLVCNLKCKLCAAYSPYQTKKTTIDIGDLKKTMARCFEVASFVEQFGITGGEPMLHPDLPELFEDMYFYLDKIGEVRIFTNGTVVPKEDLLFVLKKYGKKFSFLIDDYGSHLSTKIPEITKVLDDFGIAYVVRDYWSEDLHCGGWVDFGDVRERKHSREGALELYSKCAFPNKLHFCFTIYGGIMRPCGPIGRRLALGLPVSENEYVNLFDDEVSVEKQREKIRNIYNATYFETCAYCNGMCDDSQRFKPAEQLTTDEVAEIRQGTILR